MSTTVRMIIGFISLFVVESVIWTTILYLVRLRKKVEPTWTWFKTLGVFLLLTLIVTGIGIIPVAGAIGAAVA